MTPTYYSLYNTVNILLSLLFKFYLVQLLKFNKMCKLTFRSVLVYYDSTVYTVESQ